MEDEGEDDVGGDDDADSVAPFLALFFFPSSGSSVTVP